MCFFEELQFKLFYGFMEPNLTVKEFFFGYYLLRCLQGQHQLTSLYALVEEYTRYVVNAKKCLHKFVWHIYKIN